MTVPDPGDGVYLTLAVVKDHLRETSGAQDARLPRYIRAAERMVVDLCGDVAPVAVTQESVAVTGTVQLTRLPVLSVTTVLLSPDGAALTAGDPFLGTPGWTLDRDPMSGLLDLGGRSAALARVTYQAGRAQTPDCIQTGTLDLIAHLWRTSQNRVGPGQRQVFGGRDPDESRPYPAGFAMPRAVLEQLAPELLPPVFA